MNNSQDFLDFAEDKNDLFEWSDKYNEYVRTDRGVQMKEMRIDTDLTFCPADEESDYDSWCWTVRLNGVQYASEILPERSLLEARESISEWTVRALRETNPFYFTGEDGVV